MSAVFCGVCGTNEFVEVVEDDGPRVAICTGSGHPEPRYWEPPKHLPVKRQGLPDGIANELGLYDDLLELLNEGEWMDTVVLEYLYATRHPDNYRWMVDRWGHSVRGPRRYSTTSFIGSTLGDLSRHTKVTYKPGRCSGFFAHNSSIGFWTIEPVTGDEADVSWAVFAVREGLDPLEWPLRFET